MFERIDRDVELAITDYNLALKEEDKAEVSYLDFNQPSI